MDENETTRGQRPRFPKNTKSLFAQKLKRATYDHGFTQAELARRAEKHLPEGMVFHKTSISRYCNAEQVPDPIRLRAVAEALGMSPADLLATGHSVPPVHDDVGALEIKDVGGGRCQIRVNQEVSFATATKIFELLGRENAVED